MRACRESSNASSCPILSIVIVTHENAGDLRDCLSSLRRHRPSFAAEVIVVDNGNRADTASLLRDDFPEVRHLRSESNVGYAAGNNQGIRVAAGRFLLVLNDDVEILPGSLERLVEFLDTTPKAGMCGPMLQYPDRSYQVSCNPFPKLRNLAPRLLYLASLFPRSPFFAPHRFHVPPQNRDEPREVDWVSGACLLVSREVIDQIGLMDERFFLYYEETDWCRRAREQGWQVWYVPAAQLIHRIGRSTARVPVFSMKHSLLSLLHYCHKHFSPAKWRALQVLMIAHLLLRVTAALWRVCWQGDRHEERNRLQALLDALAKTIHGV